MSKLYRYHPRPRIQRAFVLWLRKNRSRLIAPIQITKVCRAGIGLRFPHYPECLSVWLSSFDLNVHVEWRGTWWDMLISLDSCPRSVHGGYRCELSRESVEIWHTREALWDDHLFEPFLSWVNEELASADMLALYGRPKGSTCARLLDSKIESFESDSLFVSVPLPSANARVNSFQVT